MSDIPTYSTYHVEELRKALSEIDESKNSEEAKTICENRDQITIVSNINVKGS